jgi:phenylalanyl-tRNA synthetase alpha chain
MENIDELKAGILSGIENAPDLGALEAVRVGALGKKGSLSAAMQILATLQPDERKEFGARVNVAKDEVTKALEARQAVLQQSEMAERLAADRVDVTLPVRVSTGTIHPLTQTIEEMSAIAAAMDFTVMDGPDIEDDWHNFEALNFPPDHPARQMHDTFYLPQGQDNLQRVLRTHTSNVQIRTMMDRKPPIRMVTMGRVFRSDPLDQTHSPAFHQFELLVVDETSSMAHLRGTILHFLQGFFRNDDLEIRFRPSFFPFTEPSAEVDMKRHNGKWMEVGGSGMVHPNVLKNCGIDPDRYQGFAWGLGLERLTMLKYGMHDIRGLYDADIRWMRHYGFSALNQPNVATGI